MFDVIVIGGGAAGLTSSIWSAQLGCKTLLIEKEDKLGGDCLHYGCVPSKSLIKSAQIYHQMRHARAYGLPDIEVPRIDFIKIRDRIKNIIGHIQKNDSPEFFKKQYNIETKFGMAKFLDAHTIEINNEKIRAKKIILATGSSARIPSFPGIDRVKYLTNVDIFSMDKLPESLIVLGAGPIGMEMAQAFSRLGSRVSVVESTKRILPKEDPDVSFCVHEILGEEGIEFFVEAKTQQIEQKEGFIYLTIEQNNERKVIKAESILIAVGREPNVQGLNLEEGGIEVIAGGIKVNRYLQTTAKNIYACGDCKGGYLFTHVAEYDARVAAINARLPFNILKTNDTTVPWCTFLDPEVASVGANETMAQNAGLDYKVYKYDFAHVDRALAEGATRGFIKILVNAKRQLIGVQIVGPHAGELIHEWVAAINARIDPGRIEKCMHVYPTLSQINKKVCGVYLSAQSPLVKLATYLFK